MNKFPIRKQMRLNEFDYRQSRYYFITICTYNRKEIFGAITENQMILNKYGKIAECAWKEIPEHYPEIKLDAFIIMPNHVHGIIIVGAGHARPVRTNHLSSIIGSYKSAVTNRINRSHNNLFRWQRSYYDHIVRTEESLNKIREYIINNPCTWADDLDNMNRGAGRACPAPTAYERYNLPARDEKARRTIY